jgi:hypothetical protein
VEQCDLSSISSSVETPPSNLTDIKKGAEKQFPMPPRLYLRAPLLEGAAWNLSAALSWISNLLCEIYIKPAT